MKKSVFALATLFLVACGNDAPKEQAAPAEEKKDTAKKEANSMPENDWADYQFSALVMNIPSPFEIISQLPKAGVPFDMAVLNPTENVSKYNTSTRKGLNYGAYVVDLVYLSTNEQFSQVKNYFMTARGLAQSLDCVESFDKVAGKRLEQNIDKKDTINKIVDQLYGEMDSYLRSNERLLTATQILVGSWVESQYITATRLVKEGPNPKNEILYQKINEQKHVAKQLVDLLKEFEKEKEFKPVIDGIKELDGLYKDLKVGSKEIDKAHLEKIQAKLSAVRTKIVG